jgi:hypothetical protein
MENCVWSNVGFCKVRQNAENQHLFSFGRAHLKLVIGSVGQPMINSKKFVTFAIYFLHKFLSLIYSTYTDGYKQNHICSLPEITYFRFYLAIVYIFQTLYHISCCNFFTQFFFCRINRFFILVVLFSS